MNTHDWSKFLKRITIKADKNLIFDYLSIQENIQKWFLSLAEFYPNENETRDANSRVEKGDTYKWIWHGSDNVANGEIFETNSPDLIRFSFLGCMVAIRLSEEEGETMLELTQSDIPLDEDSRKSLYVGCTRGWTFYLTNLKSILEGGIDLRNRNGSLVNVINT